MALGIASRIFDVEEIGTSQLITVYQYDSTSSDILPMDSLNLLVTSGHIRFLTPTKETYPGPWGRWSSFVSEVRNLDWQSWQESLDADDGTQPLISLLPCQMCGNQCKTVQPSRGGLAGPSGGTPDETIGRWEKPNPWIHQVKNPVPADQDSLDLSSRDCSSQSLNACRQPWQNYNRRQGESPRPNMNGERKGSCCPKPWIAVGNCLSSSACKTWLMS